MSARVRWTALLLLGGLWAGLALWYLVAAPEPQRVPLKYVTGQAASREVGRGKARTDLKIRMDLLEAERKQATGTFVPPKNIFAPLRQDEPVERVAKARRDLAPSHSAPPPAPVAPPGPTPEEMAAQAAQAELAQFRYLGFLSRQNKEEAFLSKGRELHIVQVGDTIDQRVLVKAITRNDVVLQETRSQVEKAVHLAGEGK
jgi:hypothetical protein